MLEGTLQSHDIYQGNSGYFKVELTTETPTFVRGMLSASEKTFGEEAKDKPDFYTVDGKTPRIPGSSLRGMLRTLFEIVTFGKIHFVSDAHRMFFRAVAADKTDPLKHPYEKILGRYGSNVKAGYLEWDKEKKRWYIKPARRHGQDAYAKVKDETKYDNVPVSGVEGMKRFNHPEYHVQYHDVTFKSKGRHITHVQTAPPGERDGVLVCSGNMAETQGNGNQRVNSPRKNYALVLNPDPNAKRIPIDDQAVRDYKEGLTAFQKEQPPFDETDGMLKHGRPVFYIDEGNHVIHFGHTPNFRVAPRVKDDEGQHAVTPLDMVPPSLRKHNEVIDWTEAVFGYVSDEKSLREPVAYAGRVSVTDARVIPGQDDYYERTFTPKILASPKPTTFQHYLEQPDGIHTRTNHLNHYGYKHSKIRGHKLYWRQMISGIDEIELKDSSVSDTQTTTMTPIRSGLQFTFRVYFDNLTDAELGALAWVLTLDDAKARHQIGMGKPFGMGVIELKAGLYLIDRVSRYQRLFAEDGTWHEGIKQQAVSGYIDTFKQTITEATGTPFDDHNRVQQLRAMLQPADPAPYFKYMQIESPQGNDYDGRPVLPYPIDVK